MGQPKAEFKAPEVRIPGVQQKDYWGEFTNNVRNEINNFRDNINRSDLNADNWSEETRALIANGPAPGAGNGTAAVATAVVEAADASIAEADAAEEARLQQIRNFLDSFGKRKQVTPGRNLLLANPNQDMFRLLTIGEQGK